MHSAFIQTAYIITGSHTMQKLKAIIHNLPLYQAVITVYQLDNYVSTIYKGHRIKQEDTFPFYMFYCNSNYKNDDFIFSKCMECPNKTYVTVQRSGALNGSIRIDNFFDRLTQHFFINRPNILLLIPQIKVFWSIEKMMGRSMKK